MNDLVGIDVEEKQRRTRGDILSFAQRYFSADEVAYLRSLGNLEAQQREFIKVWTLKEAYVKALGRGFWAAPFRDFTIRFEPPGYRNKDKRVSDIILETSKDASIFTNNWLFALLHLENTHCAAICLERESDSEESMRLKAWKTIPLIEDELISGTDAISVINGSLTL